MMSCFRRMVDRRKAISLISGLDHWQRFSPTQISVTPLAGFELTLNLSSGFVQWPCAVLDIRIICHFSPRAFICKEKSVQSDLNIWFCSSQCKVSAQSIISQNFLETCGSFLFVTQILLIGAKTISLWASLSKISGNFCVVFSLWKSWEESAVMHNNHINYLSNMRQVLLFFFQH